MAAFKAAIAGVLMRLASMLMLVWVLAAEQSQQPATTSAVKSGAHVQFMHDHQGQRACKLGTAVQSHHKEKQVTCLLEDQVAHLRATCPRHPARPVSQTPVRVALWQVRPAAVHVYVATALKSLPPEYAASAKSATCALDTLQHRAGACISADNH